MSIAWNLLVFVCAALNAICAGLAWYGGEPAWWFVWVSSIMFSVDVAVIALKDLLEAA